MFWRKYLLRLVFVVVFMLTAILQPFPQGQLELTNRSVAQETPLQSENFMPLAKNQGALIPDWAQITFGSFPSIQEAGELLVPPEWAEAIGYDISRTWQAGTTLDQILKVGDLHDSLFPQNFNLHEIAQVALSKIDLSQVPLNDLELIEWQTVNDLVTAIPYLEKFRIDEIIPVKALLESVAGTGNLGTLTLEEILQQNPQWGELLLSEIDLSDFTITDIPNLEIVPLSGFRDWQNSNLNGIPGLNDVPLANFPLSPNILGIVGIVDMAYGTAETDRRNTITGSFKEGFQVPCKEKCAYTELVGAPPIYGKQWISGKYQKVKGGSGFLGQIKGMEPTGRHPFGKLFKVVVWDVVETEDRVDTVLFFRFCRDLLGCTGYVFGPIPFLSYHVADPIFVGLLDDQGGASTRDSIPDDVYNDAVDTGAPNAQIPEDATDSELPADAPTEADCNEKYKGVTVLALKQAIANIESQGSGGYQAIGDYVCDKAGLCGRALGKYQFMTYNPYAQKPIVRKRGGADFLKRANNPNNSDAYKQKLSQELLTYFPEKVQEAAFSSWLKSLIDKAAREGRSGDDLIARVGELHNAGEYSSPGSAPVYGKRTEEEYKTAERQVKLQCAEQTDAKCGAAGRFKWPTNAPINSSFGWRWGRMHRGADMAAPIGTPIRAGNCGTVVSAGWNDGGYGNLVEIRHPDGFLTRYGHNNRILVRKGQKVALGQQISEMGTTGRSTGPHLHFETHPPGKGAQNPVKFLYR